ncbi:MAG: DUF393 domain-containing protein, partial [Actinomycetota bacterium]|nr:DUF393 domain-containing protein [Actinomycetota bacterium]
MAAPNLPVLVFDGDCGICTKSAKWVRRHLRPGSTISVEPSQSLDLDALGLSATDVADAAWFVDEHGRRHRGHRAVAVVLRRIGGRWGVLGRILTLPVISWLAAFAYAWVARNRG